MLRIIPYTDVGRRSIRSVRKAQRVPKAPLKEKTVNIRRSLASCCALALACAALAQPVTLALYRNKNTGRPTLDRIGPNGQVLSKTVLSRLFPADATTFAVGPALGLAANPGAVAAAYISRGVIWVLEFINGAGRAVRADTVNNSSKQYALCGIANFDGDAYSEVIYRELPFGPILTVGPTGYDSLDLSTVDLGTYTTPVGVVDADGDGDPDLVMQDPATKKTKDLFFEGRVAVKLRETPFNAFLDLRSWVGVSDVDGNGTADLFTRKEGFDTRILFRQGVSRLGQPVDLEGDRFRELLAVGQYSK